MFDPEQVRTAESLQRPGWVLFWSPYRRVFTALPLFVRDRTLVLDEPRADRLLQRMSEVEMAASVGALGAQPRPGGRSGEVGLRALSPGDAGRAGNPV
jgi:hypothetical protein